MPIKKMTIIERIRHYAEQLSDKFAEMDSRRAVEMQEAAIEAWNLARCAQCEYCAGTVWPVEGQPQEARRVGSDVWNWWHLSLSPCKASPIRNEMEKRKIPVRDCR